MVIMDRQDYINKANQLLNLQWPVFVYCLVGTIWKSYLYTLWNRLRN